MERGWTPLPCPVEALRLCLLLMLGHLVALVVRLLAVEIISLRLPRGKWGLGRSVRLASQ